MNEIRDLIIGIDFGKEYSQICYYDRKGDEPRSVSMKVGSEQFEAPTLLCHRGEHKDYCVGLEAEYFARDRGGILIDSLYDLCRKEEAVQVGTETKQPWELLAVFLKGMLKFLGVMDVVKNTKCLVITAQELDQVQVSNFQRACQALGFLEDKYLLLDYGESFFYYIMTQKRETWNRSVGWYDFNGDRVQFRKLVMQGGGPVLVQLEDLGECSLTGLLTEEAEASREKAALHRDSDFLAFIQKNLGTDLYSSIQITGKGFDPKWAKQSVRLLCQQRRKVYFGNNLFAKGACGAGKEKTEDRNLKGYRYLSPSLVLTDVGMEMQVMGSPTYYPLIHAGVNWYECKAGCELILDDTKELVFVVSTMGQEGKKRISMGLPGLPMRPNKTTRLSLELQYISKDLCRITVKDLGFGEMYPSSGKVWKDSVKW